MISPTTNTTRAAEQASPPIRRFLASDWPWVAAVLLVAAVAVWPAVSQPGLLNTRGGGDSPFLLQRLHQLTAALADGHFPVRWMPDANYGYGYPFYNYYAPLSIYVAAAFRFLGFSFVRAIHLAQLAGFVAAGLGTFYLGRRWLGSPWAGLLAAVAYTVAPFHMVNIYVRGDSLAEFWAMAFYPLVLLAADGLLEGSRGAGEQGRESTPARRYSRPLALFALAYAALILSHNISALIFSPFLLLYLGLRLLIEQESTQSPNLPISQSPSLPLSPAPLLFSLLLAFALAAWFFIPALAEQDLAQLGPVIEGYFHYSNHFRGLDLVGGGLIFDYNPDGGRAFRMSLVQAALAIAGAAAMLYAWRSAAGRRLPTTGRVIFLLLGMLIAVVMVTPLSRPLWDNLPLLPFTQFPWRFLSVASFMAALLTGALVLVTKRPAARAAIAILGSLILLASGLLGLKTDHLILTDADVTAERLAQYEWFTGNIGTTVSAEYLTPAAAPRPWTSAWINSGDRDRINVISGTLESAELLERETRRQRWRVTAGEGSAEIIFPTLYWPGWRATIDGRAAELHTFPASGLMALAVPSGEHEIVLELGRTPVRLAAELLSLTALVITFILLAGGRRSAAGRLVVPAIVIAVLLLLLALLWREGPDHSSGDLTWDFAQMGYLHHDPDGVGFTDGSRLHQYGYSADEIAAGETLTITLSIAPGESDSATLSLVTPASARPTPDGTAEPPVLGTQTQTLDGETAVFYLTIPSNAPAGLYVPRLIIDGARPLMPSGGMRGDLFLRPVRVASTADHRPTFADNQKPAADILDVRALSMVERDATLDGATTLDGQFVWLTARPFGGRYQVSWRVQNGDGLVLSQLDTQPGYGFQPTDGWPPGEPVNDWLALRLPDDLSGPPPYTLVLILYDVTTGEELLTRRVGEIVEKDGRTAFQSISPIFTPPGDFLPMNVSFGEEGQTLIRLHGYEQVQRGDILELTLYWQAMGDILNDFTRFVHLIDASGAAVAQVDSHPAGNSYPTGQWIAGEVVGDTVTFDLSAVPAGEYRLATGFYPPVEGLPRLEAFAPDGPLPDGRILLPESIVVP